MSLPASQYSVLDAERIERIDDNTFRCYVYRIKFFAFEVCPVLVVRVDEESNGCCIRLLSCKVLSLSLCDFSFVLLSLIWHLDLLLQLEGSPLVEAQNEKFSGMMRGLSSKGLPMKETKRTQKPLTLIWYGNAASMVNRVSCSDGLHNSTFQQLATDTVIEVNSVTIDIPFAFRAIPVEVIESTGTQVLEQLLRLMLPRFLAQVS
ncbi:hypothetical protein BHE74_00019768 [Ensete ventricosum]|nr:hypothetical protein GW17_00028055 [Ensete ventricosum]RWW72431.1 hypothetical protein BHE74_00019768 [Ensete ventricosum]RZR81616.1 hypothetical protein BHM03_00007883 [Ensete ventricosum]